MVEADFTVAIIGAGHMGASLVAGLIQHGLRAERIWAADIDEEKIAALHKNFNIHITVQNAIAVAAADVVIFALKPQQFPQTLADLQTIIAERKPLIISIAAGITISSIRKRLANLPLSIVRAMPNLPALIGAGVTALYADNHVSETERFRASQILGGIGIVVWLQTEDLMDIVTALSGSGPAYFFHIFAILQESATDLGLPKDIASLLTLQTALGAAKMAIESGKSLAELKQSVSSPGGTTERALQVLEEEQLHRILARALSAAKQRAEELAKK